MIDSILQIIRPTFLINIDIITKYQRLMKMFSTANESQVNQAVMVVISVTGPCLLNVLLFIYVITQHNPA